MEYDVLIRNVFATPDIIEQLSGRNGWLFFGSDNWLANRSFVSGDFDPHYSIRLLDRMRSFSHVSVHTTPTYSLYQVSNKGSLTLDYYHLPDLRTLVYDRRTRFAYWQEPLALDSGNPLEVTAAQLKAICPEASLTNIQKHIGPLNTAMQKYQINTRLRQAHFLAQVSVESDHFRATREYASGKEYEGRADLGNTETGDGVRFAGRGLIQITGRDVYIKYGRYLGRDLTQGTNMKLVEQEPWAADAAGYFWLIYKKAKDLNGRADRDSVESVTRAVNGGHNGLAARIRYTANAKKLFGLK
ncbi:MAG: glycoside hydrolase family 19 protein [Janthinobacterium lividum]